MENCEKCEKTREQIIREGNSLIHGTAEKTKKPMSLCIPCFQRHYVLVPGEKENVFREKRGT